MQLLNGLLTQNTDFAALSSEDRRQHLLGTFVVGWAGITLVLYTASILYLIVTRRVTNIVNPESWGASYQAAIWTSVGFLAALATVYWINRRNTRAAGWLFVVLCTGAILMADTPIQLVNGRSVYLFVVPMLIGAFVISPGAVLVIWAGEAVLMGVLTHYAQIEPPWPTFAAMLFIAFTLWFATAITERTISDLQRNQLSQQAEERPRE